MKDFFIQLSSLYWWLSVVIVGILINIASAYLKTRLDARVSKASTWWRNKSEARKNERLKKIAELNADSHKQIMIALRELRHRVRFNTFLILAIVSFAFGMVILGTASDVIGFMIGNLLVISSLVSSIAALDEHRLASQIEGLIKETIKDESASEDSTPAT